MRDAEYYLVVDLEATCDDHGAVPRHESEIIEIGAVLVDGKHLRPVAELMTFVRPVLHPGLTAFCTELTTITQDQVDDAPTFPAAAARLAAFGAGALFCSWGNYDRNQLAADAARHGLASPLGPDHLNVKQLFADRLGVRRGLGTHAAMARVGLRPEGTHHRGIDDARNIARLLAVALRRGAGEVA
ncbi:MAG: exonuclease domain-containing protein [Deltaproteobacteria bacterium]|nr:exonuclease domain-containing protein [Deltaproteobacteria bacterium]